MDGAKRLAGLTSTAKFGANDVDEVLDLLCAENSIALETQVAILMDALFFVRKREGEGEKGAFDGGRRGEDKGRTSGVGDDIGRVGRGGEKVMVSLRGGKSSIPAGFFELGRLSVLDLFAPETGEAAAA